MKTRSIKKKNIDIDNRLERAMTCVCLCVCVGARTRAWT